MISSPSLIGSNSVCAKSESRFFKPWLQAKRKAGRWWFSRRWKRAPLTTAHMRQVQRYNCGTVDEQWHIATIVQQEANTQKTLLLYLWFSELKNWAWKPFSKNKIHPYKSTETNKPSLFCVLCTPTKRNSFEKLSLSPTYCAQTECEWPTSLCRTMGFDQSPYDLFSYPVDHKCSSQALIAIVLRTSAEAWNLQLTINHTRRENTRDHEARQCAYIHSQRETQCLYYTLKFRILDYIIFIT